MKTYKTILFSVTLVRLGTVYIMKRKLLPMHLNASEHTDVTNEKSTVVNVILWHCEFPLQNEMILTMFNRDILSAV